jgi:hypothetical protein
MHLDVLRELVPVPWLLDGAFRSFLGVRLAYSGLWVGVQAVLVALLAVAAWRARRFVGVVTRRSGAAFVLVSTACFLLVYSAGLARVKPWQRVPLVLCVAVGVGLLAFRRPRLARGLVVVGLAGVLLRVPLGIWQAASPRGHAAGGMLNAIDAARWLSDALDPADRVGSWNASGALGFFSSRTVINLDGLVNDAEFRRDVLGTGEFEAYLRRERVRYVADPACGSQPAFAEVVERVTLNVAPHARERFRALAERPFELVKTFRDPSVADPCAGIAVWRVGWLDETED